MSILDAHITTAPRAGRFARIAEAFHRAREMQAQRTIYIQTLRELRSLSERDLADLGIEPQMIEDVARKATYGR